MRRENPTIEPAVRTGGARGGYANSRRERHIRAFHKALGRRLRRRRERRAWQKES